MLVLMQNAISKLIWICGVAKVSLEMAACNAMKRMWREWRGGARSVSIVGAEARRLRV